MIEFVFFLFWESERKSIDRSSFEFEEEYKWQK